MTVLESPGYWNYTLRFLVLNVKQENTNFSYKAFSLAKHF